MYQYFPYKEMGHRQILLYGFHFSFLFIFALAILRDLYFQHYFNASINLFAWLSTGASYYLLHYKKHEILTREKLQKYMVNKLYAICFIRLT